MSNDQSNSNAENSKQKFDLEERTAKFAERIVDFCKKLPRNAITDPIIRQLIRSGTSIGANYYEANEASSRKDFVNKMSISKKEANETKYWLRIIAHSLPETKEQGRVLWKEAQEFTLIFATIIRKSKVSKV